MPIAASKPAAEHELIELGREATAALDALLADAVRKVETATRTLGFIRGAAAPRAMESFEV